MVSIVISTPTSPARALSEHRVLRLVTLFLLYVAQGLPLGLMQFALPGWLAQNNASATAVGSVLAMVTLPWTAKLLYGFVMDRYAFLAMGRRRPWIIVSQLALIVTLVAMAVVDPGVAQIGLLSAFAFALGLWSASQDVAVDGLAVDILPAHEIERVNGVMFGGQAIGIATGGAIGGTLIATAGLPAAALALAAILAAILMLVLIVRERPGERLMPWSRGAAAQRNLDLHIGAFGPIIRNLFAAMFTRQTLLFLPAAVLTSACWGLFLGLAPIFAADVLGWQKATYSGWASQAALVAGVAGGLLFGLAAGHWGARRLLIVAALGYVVVAAAMNMLQPHWSTPAILIAAIFAIKVTRTLNLITFASLAMRLCTPAIAATQFAVFMAVANLGLSFAPMTLGWLDSLGGIPAMFTAMIVCGLGGAAFAFIAKVGR